MNQLTKATLAAAALVLPSLAFGFGGTGGTVCPQPGGPDAIMGDIPAVVANYAAEAVGEVEYDAFSFGHTFCNIGDENLLVQFFPSNQHPIVVTGLCKLKDGRFEQVGMSWVFHTFFALANNACGCGCNGELGDVLGVGCSDPSTAARNGSQSSLGPRWQINAHSGVFPINGPANPPFSGTTSRRVKIKTADLEPSGPAVKYFVERLCLSQHEAGFGNQNNNASYREAAMIGGPSNFTASLLGSTVREQAAVRAWKANDPAVVETDLQLTDEGLFILAAKATDLGDGMWHYEYAVENLNSDASGRSFSIPLPPGAVITNVGFHDVDYHSGDAVNNFNNANVHVSDADWPATVTHQAITWATEPFESNINANALRWGTLYNFRFDSNRPPSAGVMTLETFKVQGSISEKTVTPGPAACPADFVGARTTLGVGDGEVGVDDLLALIESWNQCIPGGCPADLTGNGNVEVDDLLALIQAWGPCP